MNNEHTNRQTGRHIISEKDQVYVRQMDEYIFKKCKISIYFSLIIMKFLSFNFENTPGFGMLMIKNNAINLFPLNNFEKSAQNK